MDMELKALAEIQASMCSVFANPKRVLILWSLAEREMSVTEISLAIDASLQCTSQHLHLMKKTGILDSHRDGQTVYYHIVNNRLKRCQLSRRICQDGT
jgi:DNA-binding transcriptional ArsR family regulator